MDQDCKLVVDAAKCVRCGLCLQECAPKCLVFAADFTPKFGVDGQRRCNGCQHCFAVCPTGALSIFGRKPEESVSVADLAEPEKMLRLIQCRRSVRSYRHENLPDEVMKKLMDMLRWVPTGVNNHSLHFSVVGDCRVMDEIRESVNGQYRAMMKLDPLPEAAALMVRYKSQIEAGLDVIFRGAPHMIAVAVPENSPCPECDPVIALSYFELYARSLGVGTVWCGLAAGALRHLPEFYRRMEIPEGYKLGYAMLFGPTDRKYSRATQPETVSVTFVK